MTHPVLAHYDQIVPTVERGRDHLEAMLRAAIDLLGDLPGTTGSIQPRLAEWDRQRDQLDRATCGAQNDRDTVRRLCQALPSLRDAGMRWTSIADSAASPFAASLQRSVLDSQPYSWKSAAVVDYWLHVDQSHQTAEALAEAGRQIGGSLTNLAGAIDRQLAELVVAIGNVLTAAAFALGLGATVGGAIGGLIGIRGGVPTALLLGLIGALIGWAASVVTLLIALADGLRATSILGDQAAAEMRALTGRIAELETNVWPSPHRFGEGSDYQER